MKNLLLIIICSSNFLYSQIYTEKYISEATDVSLNWLRDLNYNKYGKAYSLFSNKVKINSDSIETCSAFKGLMKEFGSLNSRKITSQKFENEIKGIGSGFFVFVEFVSVYEKKLVSESIILQQDDNLKWRILRYDFAETNRK